MRFEYLVVKESIDETGLNALGAEGWELVAVTSPAHFVIHHFFKRPA
ncbi:hypothetical protein [Sphingomonas yantingensis]|uniref:DUF4177 domain-containing protein n=1 Tax=Sphingomonas yantingensis TaxID=1241761 RepID=A0A7W9ASH3_9SPHN|nr:hypothetical protein [Sphingomonas yantingensis]MBB5699686.1 hypothetical protein [Sphingomonas yantingensis]